MSIQAKDGCLYKIYHRGATYFHSIFSLQPGFFSLSRVWCVIDGSLMELQVKSWHTWAVTRVIAPLSPDVSEHSHFSRQLRVGGRKMSLGKEKRFHDAMLANDLLHRRGSQKYVKWPRQWWRMWAEDRRLSDSGYGQLSKRIQIPEWPSWYCRVLIIIKKVLNPQLWGL